MKAKKYWILATIILVICAGGVLAANKFIVKQRDVLAGLQGMGVVVEKLDDGSKEAGLTREQIQTDVELKLRLAGIKVLSREKYGTMKSGAYLYVQVNAIKMRNFLACSCNVSVSLIEIVHLARDPAISVYAETWNKNCIIIAGSATIGEAAQKVIKNLVDMFINDYLATNTKETAKKKAPTLDELLKKAKPKDEQTNK